MTTTIYNLHDKAFAQVSAFVVVNSAGDKVATVAFKYPKDGAGRLYCYLHIIGLEMVRGYAGGYGYDKARAAFDDAVKKVEVDQYDGDRALRQQLVNAIKPDNGSAWGDIVNNIGGYRVLQAV